MRPKPIKHKGYNSLRGKPYWEKLRIIKYGTRSEDLRWAHELVEFLIVSDGQIEAAKRAVFKRPKHRPFYGDDLRLMGIEHFAPHIADAAEELFTLVIEAAQAGDAHQIRQLADAIEWRHRWQHTKDLYFPVFTKCLSPTGQKFKGTVENLRDLLLHDAAKGMAKHSAGTPEHDAFKHYYEHVADTEYTNLKAICADLEIELDPAPRGRPRRKSMS